MRRGFADGAEAATERELTEQDWTRKTEDFKEGIKSYAEKRAGTSRVVMARSRARPPRHRRRLGYWRGLPRTLAREGAAVLITDIDDPLRQGSSSASPKPAASALPAP